MVDLLKSLSSLQDLEFSTGRNVFRPIFPTIIPPLKDSLILVGGSLVLSVFVSLILAFIIVSFKKRWIEIF
jgi:ABC-type dipeptide/oligopeptide/nickel transport system permease component